jgi:RNA polymerase sigma-70 factor (ECF subfamily)
MDKNSKKTEVFLSLLMANQRRINSYVLSLVPNFSDADDIMQETISVMWSKFDQFEVGTDFTSWGIKVAYYHIMTYRKKKAKDKLVLSENLFLKIDEIAKEKQHHTDERINHLRHCIEKLNPVDQRFLKARYELNYNANNLAVQLDRSVQYVYKHMARIFHTLNLCVKRVIREAEVQ